MRLEGMHSLPVAPGRAYALLQDPLMLAKCMPGCEALERIGEDVYHMKMKMVLASMSGLFDGTVKIAEANPPVSFRLVVEGAGKIGFMKGDGLLTLTVADNATNVQYEGDVQVGGTIAAVGQRLVVTTARMITRRFFERLYGEAVNGAGPGTASEAAEYGGVL